MVHSVVWRIKMYTISVLTHGSVSAFLSSVFSSSPVHLNVDVIDDVEKVLHDGDLFVLSSFTVRLAGLLVVGTGRRPTAVLQKRSLFINDK